MLPCEPFVKTVVISAKSVKECVFQFNLAKLYLLNLENLIGDP